MARPVASTILALRPATADDAGLSVDVVADEHTIDGLVEAVVAALPS